MKITKVEAIPVRQKGEIKKINDSAQDGLSLKFIRMKESLDMVKWIQLHGL